MKSFYTVKWEDDGKWSATEVSKEGKRTPLGRFAWWSQEFEIVVIGAASGAVDIACASYKLTNSGIVFVGEAK